MCGRFSQSKSKQDVKKRFNAVKVNDAVTPMFNIAPDMGVPIILNTVPEEITLARWGLLPSWSKEEKSKYSMINARAETLYEKPAFKRLVKSHRCLIIADSFYEWKKVGPKKQPYRIMLKDGELFAFAGLWDLWEKGENAILSCTIITTSANELVNDIHDRMPVILPREQEQDWLNFTDTTKILRLLRPFDAERMQAYQISTMINNPGNDSSEVILPLK
jgi:putative SOS response-associated peptidase YedK